MILTTIFLVRKLAFNLYSCICLGRDLRLVAKEPLQAGKPQSDVLNSKHCSNEFYDEQAEKLAANAALQEFLTVMKYLMNIDIITFHCSV